MDTPKHVFIASAKNVLRKKTCNNQKALYHSKHGSVFTPRTNRKHRIAIDLAPSCHVPDVNRVVDVTLTPAADRAHTSSYATVMLISAGAITNVEPTMCTRSSDAAHYVANN